MESIHLSANSAEWRLWLCLNINSMCPFYFTCFYYGGANCRMIGGLRTEPLLSSSDTSLYLKRMLERFVGLEIQIGENQRRKMLKPAILKTRKNNGKCPVIVVLLLNYFFHGVFLSQNSS